MRASKHATRGIAPLHCLVALLLMTAAGQAEAAPRFVFSTFKSDAVADEKLFTYESTDGLNFKLISATGYSGPSPGTLRDPSIIRYVDGKYYVAHTNPQGAGCCGKEDHFSIASSTDLVHWTEHTRVLGGIPNLAHVWAPEWFVEGSTVNVIANMDTGAGDFEQYLFTARDASLTSWSGPVRMNIATNHIDTYVMKLGTTYHAFVKSEATRFLEHATAAKLTGPWTLIGKDDWAGWGSGMEGPSIVKLDDGTWRVFLDPQQSTFFYSDSKDLMTWTKPVALPGVAAVVRHGTVIRDIAVGEGGGGAGGGAGAAGGAGGGNGGASGGAAAGAGAGGTSGSAGAGGALSNAGAPGAGGLPELGGATSGGTTASAGALAVAGGNTAAGAPAVAGAAGSGTAGSASAGAAGPSSDAGCSCRTSPGSLPKTPLSVSAVLGVLGLAWRRVQRRKAGAVSLG